MSADHCSHTNEQQAQMRVDIHELRRAIPSRCFQPSNAESLSYIARDVGLAGTLAYLAFHFIPTIDNFVLRWLSWALYGWTEGLLFTGLWVIGHECGHGSQFPSRCTNDLFGFLFHSALLTPYFSWKFTHRRHHVYANHITKDLHYVPPRRQGYLDSLQKNVHDVHEYTEDAPLFTLVRIILQQAVGWPFYLAMNITAAPTSLPKPPSSTLLGNSHFAPFGSLFLPDEAFHVLLSDFGILCTTSVLWWASSHLEDGTVMVLLLYLQPYLWLNHWIVAITYLHHTDPQVPKYEPQAWNFFKGATATIDRDFGFIGRNLLHGIIEFHVIHHLFPQIPFYHAKEATDAVVPLLGDSYHSRKGDSFYYSLWEAFTKCQYVDSDDTKNQPGALWFRAGPSPPPEYDMGKKLRGLAW